MNRIFLKNFKSNKPFKLWDLLLYFLVAILVLSLFCFFVFFPARTSENNYGFKLVRGGKDIFCFNYNTHTYTLSAGYDNLITVEEFSEGFFNVKVFADTTKNSFNTIEVDSNSRQVSVTDSNCSNSKDCVHTSAIKDGYGIIICVPHDLKILPVGDGYRPIVTG